MKELRLATRASPLALWQTRFVAAQLHRRWPGLRTRLVPVVSTGDRDTTTPLYGMGNIGVFAKEVHEAVLAGRADLAVHSCKDLPTTPVAGLCAPVLLRRHDPRDSLIGVHRLDGLRPGAVVGSSSLRRRALLADLRPDLRFVDIRGNVATRIGKVVDGTVDATLLARAGLARLGTRPACGMVTLHPVSECVPAVAQGAIAVDARTDDGWGRAAIARLHHPATTAAVDCERAVLAGLRGGCSLPLGCHVFRTTAGWRLEARLQTDAGLRRVSLTGPLAGLADRALAQLTG